LTTSRNEPAPIYPVLVLLGASTLWGLTWLPLKYFAGFGIEGTNVTLVAHGSVGVLALFWLARHRNTFVHRALPMLLLAALGGLANLTFASAMVKGDVVRVMVLFYLLPAWGVAGGFFFLRERIDAQRWLSLVCALAGAFLVLGGFHILNQAPSFTDLLAVLAGLSLAANNVVFRKLSDVPVPTKMASMFAGTLLWTLPLTLLGIEKLPSGVPAGVWLELSAFGLIWLSVATIGTLWGVAHLEAGRSSVLIIMELFTAVISAALLSDRTLSPLEWLGGSLIVAAALLEAWRRAPEALPRAVGDATLERTS
jgi:drug/metabolite transporter (DMT)-like permease